MKIGTRKVEARKLLREKCDEKSGGEKSEARKVGQGKWGEKSGTRKVGREKWGRILRKVG